MVAMADISQEETFVENDRTGVGAVEVEKVSDEMNVPSGSVPLKDSMTK